MKTLAVFAAFAALCLTGCDTFKGADWSGGIVCKDGVCTPTLTVQPLAPAPAPRAQLEK